ILALALGSKGALYAGTDKGGLIYRIESMHKGFVLYHAPQSEVRSLFVTPDAIYAGTSSPTRRPAAGGKTTTTLAARPIQVAAAGLDLEQLAQGAPPPSTAPVGENSVYRIGRDGSVREIFRDKVLVSRLLLNSGKLLVATGMQGQLFEVDEATKEKTA